MSDRQIPSRRLAFAGKNACTILITGATGGLGTALAHQYARTGRHLILHGRNSSRLSRLALECEERGAQVTCANFDLCDPVATTESLRRLSTAHVIDLAIVNAGVSQTIGRGEEVECWELARAVLAVNLDGAILTVAGVLPEMRRRGAGQIALISSLAAYVGLPVTPTYCASKAGLKAYGEALRGWLEPQGVAVNVVLPGFVRTAMSARFPAATPGMISPEQAAKAIQRGLECNRARISFPRGLAVGMWGLSVLPATLTQRILRTLGFGA